MLSPDKSSVDMLRVSKYQILDVGGFSLSLPLTISIIYIFVNNDMVQKGYYFFTPPSQLLHTTL